MDAGAELSVVREVTTAAVRCTEQIILSWLSSSFCDKALHAPMNQVM